VDVDDVVVVLRRDHESLSASFAQMVRGGESKTELFLELANRLIRHEVAEEIVVYPALQGITEGEQLADARLADQSEIESQLFHLERVGLEEEVIQQEICDLWSMVFEHAEQEEAEVLPFLSVTLPLAKRIELGRRYAEVRDTAPNRPHPHAGGDPIANTIVGPMAALADWIRDSARSDLWQVS
jgi:hemerythrin superfamily protein